MPVARGSRGNGRKWHSLHGSAGGGSSARGNPVRYANCAATSSYRNESIETFSRRYTAFLLPVSLVRALDILHKASVNPRYAPIKYFSVCAERSLGVVPRNLEPEPRILRILALIVVADCPRFAQSCAVLRAEKQLDAVPPFLHLEESSSLRRIIPIGTQRVFPLE